MSPGGRDAPPDFYHGGGHPVGIGHGFFQWFSFGQAS